jgi:hypothetical protein
MLATQHADQVSDSLLGGLDLLTELAAHGFGNLGDAALAVDEVPKKAAPFVETDFAHGQEVAHPFAETA